MPKALHISKYYYPFRGGTEAVAQDIAEGVTEFDNKVLAFNHEAGNRIDKVNGIEVHRAGCVAKVASQPLSLSYFPMMKRLLTEWQPSIVHLHHPNPLATAVLLPLLPKQTKLIVHWHLDIVNQRLIYPLFKGLENKLLKRADRVVATSERYIEGSAPLTRFRSKVQVIYNGIDTERLNLRANDGAEIEQMKTHYGGRKIIFFIGRHVPYKGLEYLIEAEPMVKQECVFVIAGEGPLTNELKAKTTSQRVHFVGKLSEDALRHHLHVADVFAFPSITKNEAFGLALAEAMYCQCAPVTFTIADSGVNEVSLNGVTGIEVENRNVAKYAEALDLLLSDESLRKQYATCAKQRVEQLFTVAGEQENFRNLYTELLTK